MSEEEADEVERSEFQRLYQCARCGAVPLCRNQVEPDPIEADTWRCVEFCVDADEREFGESGA